MDYEDTNYVHSYMCSIRGFCLTIVEDIAKDILHEENSACIYGKYVLSSMYILDLAQHTNHTSYAHSYSYQIRCSTLMKVQDIAKYIR